MHFNNIIILPILSASLLGCSTDARVQALEEKLANTQAQLLTEKSNALAPPTPAPAPAPEPEVEEAWELIEQMDPATGKTQTMAVTSSLNTVNFGFPYNGDQHGHLMVRNHPINGLDVIFSVNKGQTTCMMGCKVIVRFDDEEAKKLSANGPSDHSTNTLFLGKEKKFVKNLKSHKKLWLTAEFYQKGGQTFEFDLEGAPL